MLFMQIGYIFGVNFKVQPTLGLLCEYPLGRIWINEADLFIDKDF